MKRIKRIQAFESPIGMGMAYLEPILTFHPPSLKVTKAPKPTKLMQRLLKQEQNKLEHFRLKYLQHQPKAVSIAGITVANFDPTDPTPILPLWIL